MKRIFGLIILAIAVAGCQKAPESTRIGSAGRMTPDQAVAATGVQINGIVTDPANNQSNFNEVVRDFMEWIISRDDVGYVSAQGGDSGFLVGGRIELANGQPLVPANGRQDLAPNSKLVVAVYDKFANQQTVSPLPARVFLKSAGYISGNTIFIKFSDEYGTVTLDGSFSDQGYTSMKFTFDTSKDYTGHQGHAGYVGNLNVPTCQFFRCQ